MSHLSSPARIAARRLPGSPSAVWAAFAQASAWKSWVMILQLFVIGLLVLANLRLAKKDPDIVLVTPDGKSTYVERGVASDALIRFLTEQKGQPSDVTVEHFVREFLTLAQAVNSSTFDEAWPAALDRMSPSLKEHFSRAANAQNLVETHQAMQVRTTPVFEELRLVERRESLIHVNAVVALTKQRLLGDEALSVDRIASDLILRAVPRTSARPDGLEVVEWRVKVLAEGSTSNVQGETSNAQ